jgi:hypothetical protein
VTKEFTDLLREDNVTTSSHGVPEAAFLVEGGNATDGKELRNTFIPLRRGCWERDGKVWGRVRSTLGAREGGQDKVWERWFDRRFRSVERVFENDDRVDRKDGRDMRMR